MATWAEFANAQPDLAAFARERMEGRIVYQATLRLDGGPRVHPVSPWLAAGLLCVSYRDASTKMREVARDPRYALHTAQPWEDHAGAFGEFMARGLLEPISPSHPAVMARPCIDGGSRPQATPPGVEGDGPQPPPAACRAPESGCRVPKTST